MKVWIAICDQNVSEAEAYKELFYKIGVSQGIDLEIRIYLNEDQLLFALEENFETIDVIFIDIKHYGIKGIKAMDKIKQKYHNKEVIFLTRSKHEFREAFDISAFNYIVKKEDSEERVEQILKKVIRRIEENDEEYVVFNSAGEHLCIPIRSIYYFEVQGRISTVYYQDGEFEFISTLQKLEEHLKNHGFVRIHRAFLVRMEKIKLLKSKMVILENKWELPVGRAYYRQVKNLMSDRQVQGAE